MWKLIFVCLVLIETAYLSEVTYYEILGVTKHATAQEIRQAYKKLAIKLHPDKNPDATEQEKFLKLTEAYETLKDPDKRHYYDAYGSYPSYTRKYNYQTQAEYNNIYYNGLYHNDPFVDTLSGQNFYDYLQEGFHFINFYSPFCPPCQNVADHWKKVAEVYKGIVKVGAVNCVYHNSFCYYSMRIGSYPTLLFYPNGKKGSFVYYSGDRVFEALDQFIMKYLKNHIHIPTVAQKLNSNKPIAYVLGSNRIENDGLHRIGYHLKGLVHLVIVEDDNLRSKLTKNEYTTIVFSYPRFLPIAKEIQSTNEQEIIKEIVEALPKVDHIDPDKLKKIRNQLRRNFVTPWVLYLSTKKKDDDRLLLHKMSATYPDMYFGELDCDKWEQLCISLQVEQAPAWAVLKSGGAYQRLRSASDIQLAAEAVRLHSLSATELLRILDGDMGVWVLVVVPYMLSWDHIVEPFTRASIHFNDADDNISFGIMTCTSATDTHCRQLAPNQPSILVQHGRKRSFYNSRISEEDLIQFIDLLMDSTDMELNDQQILEIMDPSSRDHTWLVAFLPAQCGHLCDVLMHEWRIVARKLRPLEFIRVGAMQCGRQSSGFCTNVRSPTARLYLLGSGQHYTVSLQHLQQAPYMLEWALEYIDDSVTKLNWNSFSKHVIAEELHPKSDKKPWLVYFHSPRCYRCYEMYADFAIVGILLNNAIHLGKVNCVNERGLCQHEQITNYPSLKLYLGRNKHHSFSSVIPIPVTNYASLLQDIKPHLRKYDENLLAGIDVDVRQGVHMKHDEF